MLIAHDAAWDAQPAAFDFYLDGVLVTEAVIRADPECDWIDLRQDAGPPLRKRGRVEAVHRESGVVRRKERVR